MFLIKKAVAYAVRNTVLKGIVFGLRLFYFSVFRRRDLLLCFKELAEVMRIGKAQIVGDFGNVFLAVGQHVLGHADFLLGNVF